jgi:hypothetical protein
MVLVNQDIVQGWLCFHLFASVWFKGKAFAAAARFVQVGSGRLAAC